LSAMAASVAAATGETRSRGASTALQPACSPGWHHPSMHGSLMDALNMAGGWRADHVALAVVGPDGELATVGDGTRQLPWASVTKPAVAYAVLRAVERGSVSLDEPLGPPRSTVRHLLAHASGLPPETLTPISPPERTRIYSNAGFDLLGQLLADRAGLPVEEVVARDVLGPLEMSDTRLVGRAAAGMDGSLADLARFARELLRPTLLSAATLDEAIALANSTRFGLQAGVFTRDVKAALHAARELEFGGVTVNEAPTFRADQMPYGGVKDSGNTREGPAYAIREMTEERAVVFQL